MENIKTFRKQYGFLSNMYDCKINLKGIVYPSVENAYQAMKIANPGIDSKGNKWSDFADITSPESKALGKKIVIRDDWNEVKDLVMWECLRQKFNNPYFKKKLLDTGNALIREENFWGDAYWGFDVKKGYGKNKLGMMLMKIRNELRKAE